jgi:hypothetical protein
MERWNKTDNIISPALIRTSPHLREVPATVDFKTIRLTAVCQDRENPRAGWPKYGFPTAA